MIFTEVTIYRADTADGQREVLGHIVGSVHASLDLNFGHPGLPMRNRFERLHGVACVSDIEITDMEAFQEEEQRGDDES